MDLKGTDVIELFNFVATIKPELKGRIKVLGGSETSLNTDAAKEKEAA